MAEATEEVVQFIKESSWVVSHGSLESCITVVSVDSSSEEPVIASPSHHAGKLVLVPSQESGPCEITIKFQGRLCNVQSFYILSTARTCEIYSQMEVHGDPEYVCTVRGWIPDEGSDPDSDGEAEDRTLTNLKVKPSYEGQGNEDVVAGDTKESACTELDGGDWLSYKEERGSHYDSSDKGISSMDSLRETDATVAHDLSLDKSIFSSSEDSWVEVKLNGSFSGECLSEGQRIVESLCKHIDERQCEVDLTGKCLGETKSRQNSATSGVQILDAEKISDRFPREGSDVSICYPKERFDSTETNPSLSGRHSIVQQILYEAEVELVDHSAWSSVTIRLLSLQNKSCVEIDQIVFLVVPGPPIPSSNSSNQSVGSGGSSALLAMLIPSMLQIVRGIPNQRLEHASLGGLSNNNKSLDKLERTVRLPEPLERTSMVMNGTSTEGNQKEISVSPVIATNNAVMSIKATQEGSQGLTGCVDSADDGTKLEFGSEGNCIDAACIPVETERIVNTVESIGEGSLQNTRVQLEGKPICDDEKGSKIGHDILTFDNFSERFDRLEALCMRMESYLLKAVESLDRRLQFLEREHSKVSMQVPSESRHYTTAEANPLTSPSNLPVTKVHSSHSSFSSVSPDPAHLGFQDLDEAASSVSLTPFVQENSENNFQDVYVAVPILDSLDLDNVAKGDSVAGPNEAMEVAVPATTEDLESRPSSLPKASSRLTGKPRLSLDDAWTSAFSAFSSSCVSSSAVSISIPHADSDSTLAKAPEVPGEIPAIALHEVEKPAIRSSLCQDGAIHTSAHRQKASLLCCEETTGERRHHHELIEIRGCNVTHAQDEMKPSPGEETNVERPYDHIMIEIQGQNVTLFEDGAVHPSTQLQKASLLCCEETSGERPHDHGMIEIRGHNVTHVQIEDKYCVCKVVENSISGLEGSSFLKVQGVNQDCLESVTPGLIPWDNYDWCSLPTEVTGLNNKEEDFPSSEKTVGHLLGEDNVQASCLNVEQKDLCAKRGGSLELESEELNYKEEDFLSSKIAVGHLQGENNVQAICLSVEEKDLCSQRRGSLELESEECLMGDEDNAACSEEGLYISQEFDVCSEGFSTYEWSGDQNLSNIQDHALTVNKESNQGVKVKDLLHIGDDSYPPSRNPQGAFQQDFFSQFPSSETCLLDVNLCEQEQRTTQVVFPGFEDLS